MTSVRMSSSRAPITASLQPGEGSDLGSVFQDILLSRLRPKVPGAIATEVKERQGRVAAPVGRHDSRPVAGEQLSQIGVKLDQVGANLALLEQIENRAQEQGFVGRPVASALRPAGTADISPKTSEASCIPVRGPIVRHARILLCLLSVHTLPTGHAVASNVALWGQQVDSLLDKVGR